MLVVGCLALGTRGSTLKAALERQKTNDFNYTERHGETRRYTEIHGDSRRFTEIHGDTRRFTEIHSGTRRLER